MDEYQVEGSRPSTSIQLQPECRHFKFICLALNLKQTSKSTHSD